MNTDIIKNIVDSLCSRMASFDQNEVFIAQLVMINKLFELLDIKRLTDILSNDLFLTDLIHELNGIENHIRTIYLKFNETTNDRIKEIIDEHQSININLQTIKQKMEKHESLLVEMKAIAEKTNESQSKISGQILEILEKQNVKCEELYSEYHNKIAILKESVNMLLRMEEDNKEIISHLNENHYVFENLKEAGLAKDEDTDKKTIELEMRANEILKEYDNILSNLLELAKKEKEDIVKRQKLVKETTA